MVQKRNSSQSTELQSTKTSSLCFCLTCLFVLILMFSTSFEIVTQAEPVEVAKNSITKTDEKVPEDKANQASLSEDRIFTDLKYLSEDEREGRGSGSIGQKEASEYIHKSFTSSGLKLPEGEEDAFLEFTTPNQTSMGKTNSFEVQIKDAKPYSLKLNQQFNPCSFGAIGKVESSLVFCGYGFQLNAYGYSDYQNVDLKGKIAVVMRRVPLQKKPKAPPFFSQNGRIHPDASLIRKMAIAQSQGATGIIFLTDPHSIRTTKERIQSQIASIQKRMEANPEKAESQKRFLDPLQKMLKESQGDRLLPFGYGGSTNGPQIPAVHMTNAQFDSILKKAGHSSLEELETQIDSDLKPRSFPIPDVTVNLEVSINRNATLANNVIGVLPGKGPNANETIVIGAHYDHVGRGGRGSLAPGSIDVHNGADDNASGTTLLMELARRLGKHSEGFDRRIVFIAFAGEELGLLGSKAYVKNPVIPLDQTLAMLNFDMVGRSADNVFTIFGTKTSSVWEPMLTKNEMKDRLIFNRKAPGLGPSDHSSFYEKKIPVLHFFTGLHGDYHRPSDDWQKVNVQGIRRMTDLVESMVIDLANKETKIDYVSISGRSNPFNAAGSVPNFGSIPDLEFKGAGYSIKGIVAGSPADKLGIVEGDVIVKYGSDAITSVDDFNAQLRKSRANQQVLLEIRRGEETKLMEVILGRPR